MKFVIIAIIMVLIAGILHMVFIGFDYGFHNPDSGMLPQLREKLNDSMLPEYRNKAYNNSQMMREAFGIGRVICIGLAIAIAPLELFKKPRLEG